LCVLAQPGPTALIETQRKSKRLLAFAQSHLTAGLEQRLFARKFKLILVANHRGYFPNPIFFDTERIFQFTSVSA
jgi:hypothetical protein